MDILELVNTTHAFLEKSAIQEICQLKLFFHDILAMAYIHSCVPVSWEAIPEGTYHLALSSFLQEKEFCRLFAALPQLTRLTFRQNSHCHPEWKNLGLALKQTPHVTALHLDHCQLEDTALQNILEGCSLELCELNLNDNSLYFSEPSLMTRLEYFTNLQ